MDYRIILKKQLEQRRAINPRFSLRSLAQKIELSPSKLSEILSGKKALSMARAELIADKLALRDIEREIFILSTMVENEDFNEAKTKIKKLVAELNGQKTEQKNAWYFGAVKALQEEGLDPEMFAEDLGLTPLQIENAQRFLKRIKKIYPERKNISFEGTSVLVRLQDAVVSGTDHSLDFLFLNDAEVSALTRDVQALFRKYQMKSKSKKKQDLRMLYFTQTPLIGKE